MNDEFVDESDQLSWKVLEVAVKHRDGQRGRRIEHLRSGDGAGHGEEVSSVEGWS